MSDTAALVAFLEARLAEDKVVAHESGPALVAWLTYRSEAGQMLYTTVAAGGEGEWDPWVADGKVLPAPASARVVYDPARVLRSVAADRAILAFRDLAATWAVASDDGQTGDRSEAQQAKRRLAVLDIVVRNRAVVYRDHPDYDPAWAPEGAGT